MKNVIAFSLLLVILLTSGVAAPAQDSSAVPPAAPASAAQNSPVELSTLPEADLVLFINPNKILNDALPKLVPAKQNDDIRDSLVQIKKLMAVDVGRMRYLAVAIRVRKPVGTEPIPLPEVLLMINGGINTATITGLKLLAGPDLHTEKYGDHEILTYTIKDIARQSETMPYIGSFANMALAAIHDDVYVAGSPDFVRAAIDADAGRGRINNELAHSLTRDPENLVSLSGSLISALARSIALISPDRPNNCDCLNRFGQTYAGVRMSGDGLRVTAAINGDNPETAGILKNLVNFLIKQVQSWVPNPEVKAMLSDLNLSVDGNEIIGSADISPATIRSLLEKVNKPNPPPPASPPSQPATVTPATATPAKRTTQRRG